MKKFPKVLIIECYFNQHSGSGITLSNLFRGWPQDKVFVAASRIYEEGSDVCKNYYRFGFEEHKRKWPFNKFQPYYKSEEIILNTKKNAGREMYSFKKSKYPPMLKRIITYLIHFFGLYNFFYPLKFSPKFEGWIKKVDPDILYFQLAEVNTILFAKKLIGKVKKPYVIHIMDDWPKTINRVGLENVFFRHRVSMIYKKLFSEASHLMSIGTGMSDTYKKRYGLEFTPFQNCVDPDFWESEKKNNWACNGIFKILYAGRIGIGTSNSILKIAEAIEVVAKQGYSVEFQIQTKVIKPELLDKFNLLESTRINKFLLYEELPKKLSSVDLLVLPMDFDRKNLTYIRESMPTKVPEYFASGTPIFVFAHESTALAKYALNEGWGEVVTQNSTEELVNSLKEIIINENRRMSLSKKASELLHKYHSHKVVRENFRKTLADIVNK